MSPFLSDKDEIAVYASAIASHPAISTKLLETRTAELGQCIKTDTGFSNMRTRYILANRAYTLAELIRIGHFVQRHRLLEQFYAEDEQGKR